MTTLNDLLARSGVSLTDVERHLDALPPHARVLESTNLDRARQAVLWDLARVNAPVTMADLVPDSVPDLTPVPFEGQNAQPLFRTFRKVFYRLPGGRIAGRNESSISSVVGHGYYSVLPGGPDGVYIDYTQLPNEAPRSWPGIRRNDRGLSLPVYGFMKDHLRRVYGRIFIGHATKPIVGSPGHFLLARGD